MEIRAKKLTNSAILPTRSYPTDAGLDLFTDEDVVIPYGHTVVIPTNIAIEIPKGYVGDVRPRSGLTLKTPIRVHYGTVDSSFRGGIGVICENGNHAGVWVQIKEQLKRMVKIINGEKVFRKRVDESALAIRIPKGSKIAQLVIHPIWDGELTEADSLDDSERGENGYGSTGI